MLFGPKAALTSLLLPWNRWQTAHYFNEATDQFASDLGVIYWNSIQFYEAIQFVSAVHELNKQDSLDGVHTFNRDWLWNVQQMIWLWIIDW